MYIIYGEKKYLKEKLEDIDNQSNMLGNNLRNRNGNMIIDKDKTYQVISLQEAQAREEKIRRETEENIRRETEEKFLRKIQEARGREEKLLLENSTLREQSGQSRNIIHQGIMKDVKH
tara:strand:- start:126 stop:479 length:354 start_codon:yes stop_codon:yes gene_type:complete